MFRLTAFVAFSTLLVVPTVHGETFVAVPYILHCKNGFFYVASLYEKDERTENDPIGDYQMDYNGIDGANGTLSGTLLNDDDEAAIARDGYRIFIKIWHQCGGAYTQETIERELKRYTCWEYDTECIYPTQIFRLDYEN